MSKTNKFTDNDFLRGLHIEAASVESVCRQADNIAKRNPQPDRRRTVRPDCASCPEQPECEADGQCDCDHACEEAVPNNAADTITVSRPFFNDLTSANKHWYEQACAWEARAREISSSRSSWRWAFWLLVVAGVTAFWTAVTRG